MNAASLLIEPVKPDNGWPPPYLLYLGDAPDELSAKTARGVAQFRPEACIGQFRGPNCQVDLGLPDMTPADACAKGARTMLVGVANAGGRMDPASVAHVVQALEAGLNVASGLHALLADQPAIAAAAQARGLTLFDARVPPATGVGTGLRRAGKRLLTVGTDCSIGKMYTTLVIAEEMRRRGMRADFRATGQTGIFIAGQGVPLDAVVADFISGAIEWLSPERHDGGWDVIEGQGSLFHASFAGVTLGLLHGAQPDALVLCHEPGRPHMRGLKHYPLPSLMTALDASLSAARLTNPAVRAVGVALNTSKVDDAEAERLCRETEDRLGLPTQDPLRHGVGRIVDEVRERFP
ncbi:MAG: N-acetyltransferase DgcN [Pseudoxanthomonas suwonensis]|nr:N-acetyltransferase DgcN [Pseudoxanthomonas suwonensis]